MEQGENPPMEPPFPHEVIPQPPMELSRALYLLYTGKMVEIPEELFNTSYDILFTHFTNKLLADPTWAEMEAGYNYFYFSNRNLAISWILEKEADRFATQVYRLIHPNIQIRNISPYQRIKAEMPLPSNTPHPMPDEPLVPPKRAKIPIYPHPRRMEPPGTHGVPRLFAAAGLSN